MRAPRRSAGALPSADLNGRHFRRCAQLGIANKPAVGRLSRLAIVVLAWAGFVSFKLSEALSGGPLIWQDSELYQKVASAGWFSSGLWTGERAPLIPILWKLTG